MIDEGLFCEMIEQLGTAIKIEEKNNIKFFYDPF